MRAATTVWVVVMKTIPSKKRSKTVKNCPFFQKLPLPQNNSELALLPFPGP
jgi:hypothetical protein